MVSASEDSGVTIVAGDLPWSGSLPQRELAEITAVVLHATETPDLAAARQIAMQSVGQNGVGLCGHLYIDRDGTCVRFVALNRIANHVCGHNRRTIGAREAAALYGWEDWLLAPGWQARPRAG